MRLHLLALVPALASTAHANKFTHTSDVKPTVTLTERSKAPPKKDAPAGPTLGSQLLEVQGLLGAIHAEQIDILEKDLIPKTPDDQVNEKADYLFRLGEIYAKLHRFHRLKGTESEIGFGATRDTKQRAALTAAIERHRAQAHKALMGAIRTYQLLVDNPRFANAPNVDVAVFYFAYTLQHAGYMKEARATYDKLLKNYPKSRYIPEAHLAFAEFHFEARQLADAEARYKKVLQYPKSSVYRYAQYKLGWVDYNLGKFAESMQAFNDVIQGTRGDQHDQLLHRAARKDFVRAYAEIGKSDKALLTFRRVGGGDGIDMLQSLADHYLDQGKAEKAIYVLRELMTERPTSKHVCRWEHDVARAMLTVPNASADDRVGEIEKLVKLYAALRAKQVLPKAEAIECREAAAEMSGQLARAYHQEGAKTKNSELLRLAGRLYRAYLGGFADAKDHAETQYFHAELAWLFAELETDKRRATQKWDDAAKAFTSVVEGGKLPPKLVQISADAAMLAAMKALHVDPRVKPQPVDDKAYETVAQPKPLPAAEAKLLAAYDGYLKYVEDGNDERVDVMFHRANLLRRYDHHAAALPVFEEIVTKHPAHETAPWSAQLALDSYNRLKNYDGMFAFAAKLSDKFLADHPTVKTTVDDLNRQGLQKQAEALQEVASKTGDIAKYVDCGAKYLEAYNKDPLAGDADRILYNAGVCYETGKSLSAAIKMYGLLQEHFPKSKHTARSLARLGNVYASVALYKDAAEALEQYATRYAGEADAFAALSDAVQFRKGLGDDAKAISDTLQFVRTFGGKKPHMERAAAAFFSMTAIYEKLGDKDKLAAHLRAYLAQHGAAGGADRRVIANAKLGQTLWQQACPVATVDGTCMKMTRVASTARRLRAASDAIPKRCGDETQAEIQMVARDDLKVRAAMAAFGNAIAEYERAGGKLEGDTRGALYHYALARFGQAERDYERFLTMQIPAGLTFDKRNPALADRSRQRFGTWFTGKSELAAGLRKEYDAIIALKDGAIAIAAAARIGATTQNFSAQLYRAEIPADQRTGPYAEDTAQAYCDTLEKIAEPLQHTAEAAYEGCLATSTRLGWFSEWSRACERELGQLKPEQYPKAFELRRQPTATATITDVEKPLSL
jgi:tetratricopeptide (TPR) repeat protein